MRYSAGAPSPSSTAENAIKKVKKQRILSKVFRQVNGTLHEEYREKIVALIGTARTRLALDYDICPIRTGETLSEVVSRIVEQWNTSFLLFETNKVVHPTFLAQVAQFAASPKPVLVVYKHAETGVQTRSHLP